MEVILTQDVPAVGKAGSVLKVTDGYARNFLLPRKLAVVSTSANLKKLEQDSKRKEEEQQKLKKEAEDLRDKINALSITIPALTQSEDKLYGSISVDEIAQHLKDEGVEVGKGVIHLDVPIKSVGIYEVEIKLHPEVIAKLKVWIVKK